MNGPMRQAGIDPDGREPRVDATRGLTEALGYSPRLTSDRAGWPDVGLRFWQGGGDSCSYAPFNEALVLLHAGGRRWRVRDDGRWVQGQSRPGCLTIVPPGRPLYFEVVGGVEGWTLHLPPSRFANLIEGLDTKDAAARIAFDFASRDPFLITAMRSLIDELSCPGEAGALYADRLADLVALHLLRGPRQRPQVSRGGLPRPALSRVLERLEHSVETGVSLETLSQIAGYSRSQFTLAFRQSTGQSPQQYLRSRRIERARGMLESTDAAIVDIAIRCGFSSQAHFSVCFRDATGISPLRYRRACA